MATQWTLSGLTTAYGGTLTTTDGYKIEAAFTWVLTTSYTSGSGETISGVECALGTCVETLDASGVRVASTVTTDGNNALCHWFYVLGGATSTPGVASTGGTNWGETKYLTHAQWGATSGAGVVGNTIKSNGTSISTSYEHTLDPASIASVFAAGTYKMTWYQPKYAATYAETALRRYNGGTADADKVKAYCVAMRLVSAASAISPLDITAASTTGTVTLTGASALAATALAFGVAALHL